MFDLFGRRGEVHIFRFQVSVTDGPNLRGPVFEKFLYEAPVREDAPKFTEVVSWNMLATNIWPRFFCFEKKAFLCLREQCNPQWIFHIQPEKLVPRRNL